ncbi:MAG: ferric reductase-like transmembrane domain-containing protein [Woeseiaceae bacterium]|nr:ferric reductase-like transmembrane domain-containing protein [Woeseiaceae bacterium]
MSRNDRQNIQTFVGVVALIGGLAALWLASVGANDEQIRFTMRESAFIAFALYVVVLVARPLQQLLRKDWTAKLLRNRRLLGVAFAAAMTAHLGLIAYRFGTQPELEFSPDPFGVGAYAVFYVMLITSFDAPKKALGPRAWKLLHRIGLLYAAVIFAVPRPLETVTEPEYLRYGIPFAIAVLIRFTAWRRSSRQDS